MTQWGLVLKGTEDEMRWAELKPTSSRKRFTLLYITRKRVSHIFSRNSVKYAHLEHFIEDEFLFELLSK
jgi:predicted SAM-dependent methyltransferase